MGGHVNMMDDVLISNLPPDLLRSALRVLVSQGSVNQKPFTEHIRQRFSEAPLELANAAALFPAHDEVSPECRRYLALTRCIFASEMPQESLKYLAHFLDSISLAKARWAPGAELESALEKLGGDIVQAVQALKESQPETSKELDAQLLKLLASLKDCRGYCKAAEPQALVYPFARAERQVADVYAMIFPDKAGLVSVGDEQSIVLDMSKANNLETFQVGPYKMPRLFNGLWQLSSPAWGSGTTQKQEEALSRLVESGLAATDMADHYGDAELIYGDFRNKLSPEVKAQVFAATKWCVFTPPTSPVTPDWVLSAVQERCRRLGGRVELLQFHWFDYEHKAYLDILVELVNLTKSHPELISTVGLCNFDSEYTQEACEHLLAKTGSVGIVSNQVQFSLFDSRPLQKMCAVCDKYGVKLLTYGSFCGGFLSSKWIGQPVPEIYSETTQLTPSQRKYFDMINNWGTWAEFQSLLSVLGSVAEKHGVSVTNVATRWVLEQPAVGAVIVGTRLGVSAHGDENLLVFGLKLSEADMAAINAAALGKDGEKSIALFQKLGDCGHEYKGMH
ncbi:aldo/keto reductase [Thozetella sp. PMI_491]|nr:aldo/keto reductase [Thozetella sp. PMI_491]